MNYNLCREIAGKYSELVSRHAEFKVKFPAAIKDQKRRPEVRAWSGEIEAVRKAILMEPRIQLRRAEKLLKDPEPLLRKLLGEKKVIFRRQKSLETLTREESVFFHEYPKEKIIEYLSQNTPMGGMKMYRYFDARDESGLPKLLLPQKNENSIGVLLKFQKVSVVFDSNTQLIIHAGISLIMAPPTKSEVNFLCLIDLSTVVGQ